MQDIADWLQVPPAGLKAFGEEVRPVKLRTVVKGYAPTKTDFLFERRLNDYIHSVIAEYSMSKPSLVFCRSALRCCTVSGHTLSLCMLNLNASAKQDLDLSWLCLRLLVI